MPWGLRRYQESGDLHFVTFTCYRREALLISAHAKSGGPGLAMFQTWESMVHHVRNVLSSLRNS
jgi:hypothetical protein